MKKNSSPPLRKKWCPCVSFIYRYIALKAVQPLGFSLHMYTYGGGKIFCNNLQALTLSFLRCTISLSHTRLHTLAWLGRNKDPTTYTSSCGTVLSLTALSTSKTASMTIQYRKRSLSSPKRPSALSFDLFSPYSRHPSREQEHAVALISKDSFRRFFLSQLFGLTS